MTNRIKRKCIVDFLGRAPNLDDQEGCWDDVFKVERDDTYDSIDLEMESIEGLEGESPYD